MCPLRFALVTDDITDNEPLFKRARSPRRTYAIVAARLYYCSTRPTFYQHVLIKQQAVQHALRPLLPGFLQGGHGLSTNSSAVTIFRCPSSLSERCPVSFKLAIAIHGSICSRLTVRGCGQLNKKVTFILRIALPAWEALG